MESRAAVEIRDAERTADDGSKMGVPGSVVMTANAGYAPRSDRLELTELTLKAPYLQVEGAGVGQRRDEPAPMSI